MHIQSVMPHVSLNDTSGVLIGTFQDPQFSRWWMNCYVEQGLRLTLSLLMSCVCVYVYIYIYIYGAPSKARNLKSYIYIYI
jgi:hypothetical protein